MSCPGAAREFRSDGSAGTAGSPQSSGPGCCSPISVRLCLVLCSAARLAATVVTVSENPSIETVRSL